MRNGPYGLAKSQGNTCKERPIREDIYPLYHDAMAWQAQSRLDDTGMETFWQNKVLIMHVQCVNKSNHRKLLIAVSFP